MKRVILIGTLAVGLAATSAAQADHPRRHADQGTFYAQAPVIRVEPIVRTIQVDVPEQECWDEQVHYPVHAKGTAGPTIVGGVIGGVVGHQIGRGGGKDTATLLGTLIGAAVGHDIAVKSARASGYEQVRYEQRCRVVHNYHSEERIEGYWVSYRYRGEVFTTRLPYDPGEYVRVRVHVAAVH